MYQNYQGYYNPAAPSNKAPIGQGQQMPIPTGLKGRPVSSLEEVRATTIDFDGSIFFFPDLANKRIYTKQINMDGTASLNMYELKSLPIAVEGTNNFITREEFESAMTQIKEMFAVPAQGPVQTSQQQPSYSF